jgi:threonine dehydrogenase-like Zn-dependent dehydrogenase
MKAAVLYGKKNIKVEEVNLPPSQGNIMIKVAACGICISDVKAYQEGQSHYCKPPVILGHEYVGNIVTTLKENNYFKKGDRVAVIHAVNCGYCIR